MSAHFVQNFGVPDSPYEQDTKEDEDYSLTYLIPAIVFMAKIFINTTFLLVYQSSFNEDIIFPFYKRATANGVCNFFARLLTVAAPLVAETPRPVPAIFLLVINSLSLIATFFLPSADDEIKFE